MTEPSGTINRREAILKTAKAAGVAAFAAPVVTGVFAAPGIANAAACNPSTDSDAVPITSAAGSEWNVNCADGGTWGRYNAQRSTFSLGALQVVLTFGRASLTDNFLVEESWYSLTAAQGNIPYTCAATWALQRANGTATCNDPGEVIATSVPNPATVPSGTTALPLPYCQALDNQGDPSCPSGDKLVLVSLVCCPN